MYLYLFLIYIYLSIYLYLYMSMPIPPSMVNLCGKEEFVPVSFFLWRHRQSGKTASLFEDSFLKSSCRGFFPEERRTWFWSWAVSSGSAILLANCEAAADVPWLFSPFRAAWRSSLQGVLQSPPGSADPGVLRVLWTERIWACTGRGRRWGLSTEWRSGERQILLVYHHRPESPAEVMFPCGHASFWKKEVRHGII